MVHVRLDTSGIIDWPSFHDASQRAFGFPGFYGRNMNAWIDCLSGLRDGDGMSRFHLAPDELLLVEISDVEQLRVRAPDILTDLVECSAAVNRRYLENSAPAVLALVFA